MPSPKDPDNAVCFLCKKSLADWEPNDNPLEEHLKHNPECGWAITAAVEANLGEYAEEDPRDPVLMEARKATFANRWPHEGKEGWNCKTNQVCAYFHQRPCRFEHGTKSVVRWSKRVGGMHH